MENTQLERLYKLYLSGNASPEEKQELMSLWNDAANEDQIKRLMDTYYDSGTIEFLQPANRAEAIFQDITRHLQKDITIPAIHRVHFLKTAWFRYAAVVVGVLAMGTYLWLQQLPDRPDTHNNQQTQVDIKPGKEGAILTLADGSELVLDSLQDGMIAEQSGSKVLLEDGRMFYTAGGEVTSGMVYNTMSTPVGRQFQFTLPDGTNVWLNAASSIRYPTAFQGKDRRVEVKGEAYFDVATNAQKPFIVETDIMDAEVLGTEFNINSYDNEGYTQTTLVNGLLRLTYVEDRNRPTDPTPDTFKYLRPGKQATIQKTGKRDEPIEISDATNLNQVIAWKQGMFDFEKVDLFNMMRQLERWYNIKVEYKPDVKNIKFRGQMYRNVNLSYVLDGLKRMGVTFEQDGNKLIIISTNN